MGTSEIAAEDFARALTQSLRRVGLHATADMDALPLHAQLLSVLHPPGDQDQQTYLTVRYRVYPHGGGDALFDRTIRTGHLVPMRAVPTLKGRQRAAIAFDTAPDVPCSGSTGAGSRRRRSSTPSGHASRAWGVTLSS